VWVTSLMCRCELGVWGVTGIAALDVIGLD
jgi:hypothetical protein